MKERTKIELRSIEYQEILGTVPPWILRWGISVFALIVIMLLIGSSLFKYPDVISASMKLTGSQAAVSIVSKSSGKISELYVFDNSQVVEGQYLAVIENSAKTRDILLLKEYLMSLNLDLDTTSVLPPKLELGSLQHSYSTFCLTLFDFQEYKRLLYFPNKSKIINERILKYQMQIKNFSKQQDIVRQQLSIIKEQLKRDSILKVNYVISNEEFETTRSKFLQGVRSYEEIFLSINNSQIQLGLLEEALYETGYEDIERANSLKSKLMTLIVQMQTEIQEWEFNYIIQSPINGKVAFTNYWAINQNLIAGESIFNVIPTDSIQLIGKAYLPTNRSGKVNIGQKVNIRFENFPDIEYGIVKGVVNSISIIPTKVNETSGYNYVVEIKFPNGLKTSYNKILPYMPEMSAHADIITKEISVFERLFIPLKKILNEGLD